MPGVWRCRGEVEKKGFGLGVGISNELDSRRAVKIVGPRALRIGTETLHKNKFLFCVQGCVVHAIVTHGERVPVVAPHLRVLAHEVIESLRVRITGCAKVSKSPFANEACGQRNNTKCSEGIRAKQLGCYYARPNTGQQGEKLQVAGNIFAPVV